MYLPAVHKGFGSELNFRLVDRAELEKRGFYVIESSEEYSHVISIEEPS